MRRFPKKTKEASKLEKFSPEKTVPQDIETEEISTSEHIAINNSEGSDDSENRSETDLQTDEQEASNDEIQKEKVAIQHNKSKFLCIKTSLIGLSCSGKILKWADL
jgi:hypothetical protein